VYQLYVLVVVAAAAVVGDITDMLVVEEEAVH
jgi:hypothetical protein